ncbi:class I SAM-dependent methyltransferase [Bailinhaonella thermotolerans]|uniref:Class I SAM-dependent methyltransferase n=1 Tax=Bailinhaonella thermotolerans TaxID=1070861 RepID=A0A3A4B922_9ACTN|nr:class I SAM-dependent methyltransferase [Bailinhaonella thermotolerans]RJL35399.1 class I SAM-dependent methyltransferase [Bailinhaonella thermotolerans]
MGLAPEILAFYERGTEDARLRAGAGRLEFWRTRDVLRRVLPAPPAAVLDVGGGSGVHAEWLARDGHRVHLIDPVPLHARQAARLPGVTALIGDARALPVAAASHDAVLLLGPLYHLVRRADRVTALAEAARAVRPGGVVAAALISRFAGLHDMIRKGRYAEPAMREGIDASVRDGVLRPGEAGFTLAYFHRPEEAAGEFAAAGLGEPGLYGLEGAAWLMPGTEAWLDDPGRRELLLTALRRTEREPSLLGVSGHLLAVATKR